jgi:hypothetical protein
MKKIFITLGILLTSHSLWAQSSKSPFPVREQIKTFLNSKTYVVSDNSILSYDALIQKNIKAFWNITPYEFITSEDFEKYRHDPGKSFIFMVKEQFEHDKEGVSYNYLNVVLGDTAKDITKMPEFVSVPLAYSEDEQENYLYKLGTIVQFIQNHIRLMDLTANLSQLRKLSYYNRNLRDLKDKTLLIAKSDLAAGVDTVSDLKKYYPYAVKIVSHDDIRNAIKDKTPNTVYLHKVGPGEASLVGRSYNVIFGADDAKIYYFNYRNLDNRNRDGWTLRDFWKIK